MTVNNLLKQLQKLVADGHGRKTVCVDKTKVTHPLEGDGCCIIPVTSVEVDTHEMMDDDGGLKTTARGVTVYRTALVIKAEC
jgi:hypothetical protein